jgi:hypothetical protein
MGRGEPADEPIEAHYVVIEDEPRSESQPAIAASGSVSDTGVDLEGAGAQ